jgi:hypothetical protein
MSIRTYRYWEPVLNIRVFRGFPESVIPDLRWRITSFELEDVRSGLDIIKMDLDNSDGKLLDPQSYAAGIVFKVSFGYPGALSPPRIMQCRKVSGALRVGGLGEASGLNTTAGGIVTLTLKSQVWDLNLQRALASAEGNIDRELLIDDMTIPDVVRNIARRYGYDGPSLHVEDSPNEGREKFSRPARFSSAEWIDKKARDRDWVFRIDSDGFHFHSDDFEYPMEGGDEELSWFRGDPDVIEWGIENDLNIPQNVAVGTGNVRTETGVSTFETGTTGGSTSLGLFRTESGKKGKSQQMLYPNLMLTAPNEGRRVEQATKTFNKAKSRWKLNLRLVGNPNVRYGRKLKLRNFGPMVDGEWRVRKAIHTIRPGEVYLTEIGAVRAHVGGSKGNIETRVGTAESSTIGSNTNLVPYRTETTINKSAQEGM